MYKKILFWQEAREKILKGINVVADSVTSTLWPRGTNVIYEETSYPTVTKDGVTVAQQVFLKDKFENMWVMLTREAAENTNRVAGDGTTSTVCILQNIMNEWNKYVSSWMNPILIKRWMDFASWKVVELLNWLSKEIKTKEDKLNIATISANNDKELWELIVDVVDEIWKDWVITVTASNSLNTEVEYVSGTKIPSWYWTPIFINNPKRLSCELENPVIVMTSDKISQQSQLIPLFEKLLAADKKEVVLFAEDIEWQALAFLIQNRIQWKFICVPVRFSSFAWYQKDLMFDLATLVKANVLGDEQGKKTLEWGLEDFGTCDKVTITRDSTLITGWQWDVIKRIDEVKTLMEWEKDSFSLEKLKERLSKLTGKAANIKVWWASDTEQSEIKYRIEDALNATKSAIEEGIVEWAGTALLRCSSMLELEWEWQEFLAGIKIVKNAIQSPFKKIITNGWENADAILGKVIESDISYNSLTMNYENLFESGIIDPTKVVKNELINAISTAWILLTSSVAISLAEVKE